MTYRVTPGFQQCCCDHERRWHVNGLGKCNTCVKCGRFKHKYVKYFNTTLGRVVKNEV